ncbi:MAG: hydantoinase/oxoprolinase family protein [Solirubrobacteraceae bacterium]
MLLGVDVGGTFTDAVLIDGGVVFSAKAPTAHDQSKGVLDAIEAVLAQARQEGLGGSRQRTSTGIGASRFHRFAHGMTVATNALLEGRGARTALIATEGFTDLIALGRQNRAELYRLCADRPAPLVADELRFAAPERTGPDGPLRELTEDAARALAASVGASNPEAVAVVLLHSYRHPEHERRLGDALRAAIPGVHVSLSHEVVGTFREYERAATTEIDAALSPLLAGYLGKLRDRCAEAGLPEPSIMQSNGGLIELDSAAAHASWTVLSGPAGGAAGAAAAARAASIDDALCFDMGGTSCDVCVVQNGTVQEQSTGVIGGRPLALPMLAIHTVGAGGGSIAWLDGGGALRAGPRSAGADPGPACYGRGGVEPTVTDANLVLGRLDPDTPLAGVSLDLSAAERAIGELAARAGLSVAACAEGIVRVANAEMVRALRVVTVERGIDPRGFALLAFGGAGGLHAAELADELGIERILCPRSAGVLSAFGMVVSPQRRDVQQTVLLSGPALSATAIGDATAELARRARAALGDSGNVFDPGRLKGSPSAVEVAVSSVFELRYRGQAFELAVAGPVDADPAWLRDEFEAEHERRYGYRDPGQELELVTIRVTATRPGATVRLTPGDGPAPGTQIAGEARISLPGSTVYVPPGWSGAVDDAGSLLLRRDRR